MPDNRNWHVMVTSLLSHHESRHHLRTISSSVVSNLALMGMSKTFPNCSPFWGSCLLSSRTADIIRPLKNLLRKYIFRMYAQSDSPRHVSSKFTWVMSCSRNVSSAHIFESSWILVILSPRLGQSEGMRLQRAAMCCKISIQCFQVFTRSL